MNVKALALLASLSLLSTTFARGQSYSINRPTLSGGGGVGLSASYRVNATFGSPIAGSAGGGAYAVTSGFWEVPVSPPTPAAPELSVTRNANDVVVSWPLSAAGWVLDRTTAFAGASTVWDTVSIPYQTNATRVFVTVPMSLDTAFFRLRKP